MDVLFGPASQDFEAAYPCHSPHLSTAGSWPRICRLRTAGVASDMDMECVAVICNQDVTSRKFWSSIFRS